MTESLLENSPARIDHQTAANHPSVSSGKARRGAELAGWAYVLGGLALAGTSFFPRALFAVNQAALPSSVFPDATAKLYAGISGGLTLGFGVAMVLVARAHRLAQAFAAIAWGLVSWYVVDSGCSLAHGSWQNAISNSILLLLGLVPMVLLRGYGPGEAAASKE